MAFFNEDYIKLSVEDWDLVGKAFTEKKNEVEALKAELARYKTKDDLLYEKELECEELKAKNKELQEGYNEVNSTLVRLNKKLDIELSNSSLYLDKIYTLKRETSCPEYRTRYINELDIKA